MDRTVLFYPTISIPNGPWLRQAVFYFDKVASIVPRELDYNGNLGPLYLPTSPEIDFLIGEDIFHAVSPEVLWLKNNEWTEAFIFNDEVSKSRGDGRL